MAIANLISRYCNGERNKDLVLALVNHTQTPKKILEQLASSRDTEIAEAANLHVNLAGAIEEGWYELAEKIIAQKDLGQNDLLIYELLEFAPISDYFINEWMPWQQIAKSIENPNISALWRDRLLSRLASKNNVDARIWAAAYEHTPVEILKILALDYDIVVRTIVRLQSSFSSDWFNPIKNKLKTQVTSLKSLTKYLEIHSYYPKDSIKVFWIFKLLAKNKNRNIRKISVSFFMCPPKVLEDLSVDFNSDIRVLIAKHRDTPNYVREQLGRDNNFEVKQAVASSSYTPRYILRQLVVNNNDERIKKAVIYNDPWYSVENTDKYVKILQDFLSKSHLAGTWNIDDDFDSFFSLQKLSETIAIDKSSQTREYRIRLAEAEDTPAYILEKLIESPEIKIRYILAKRDDLRLDLSDELWAKLVVDSNRYSITARISKQSNEYTLVNLGKDVEAIPFFIQHHAENNNSFSRYIVLSHPLLPHYLFNKYIKSNSWLERYALTQNPNTPKYMKQTLTKDANKIVRAAAKSQDIISNTVTELIIPQTITDNKRLLATLKVLTKPLTEYFKDPDAWEIKESYQETIWKVKKKTAFFSDFLEDNGILNRISVESFIRRFQMQACREFSGEEFNSQLIDPPVTEESIIMSQNLIALLQQNLYQLEAYTVNYKRSQNLFPLIVGQTIKEDWLGVSIALGSQYRKEIQPSNINFESINVASHFIPIITSLKPIIDNLYPFVRLNLALPYSRYCNPEISQGIIWKTAKSKELLIEELLKSANFIQNIEFNEQKNHYTDINRFYLSFLENTSIYAIGYNYTLRSLLYGHEKYTIGTTSEKDWLVLKAHITDAP